MNNLILFFIILFSISCTYKGNLSEVNYIKKRYRLSNSYYDPYDKYYRYNWKKRAISNITEYDSLGFVTDYCRAISDDYIYFSKDTTKWNTNPFEEYMNYHIVIDKKNNYARFTKLPITKLIAANARIAITKPTTAYKIVFFAFCTACWSPFDVV